MLNPDQNLSKTRLTQGGLDTFLAFLYLILPFILNVIRPLTKFEVKFYVNRAGAKVKARLSIAT